MVRKDDVGGVLAADETHRYPDTWCGVRTGVVEPVDGAAVTGSERPGLAEGVREAERGSLRVPVARRELADARGLLDDDAVPEVDANVLAEVG